MDFKDLVQKRRSIRRFTDEELTPEQVQTIVRAGLMAPTSKGTRAWHFLVVDDKDTLERLSQCRPMGSDFVKGAALAIVVGVDSRVTDVWTEDGSIAAVTMQYQAADLGLGSCWAQVRLRVWDDGTSAAEIVRSVLNAPQWWEPVCIVGFGHPAQERKLQDEDKLKWEAVHVNGFAAEE